jgi:serine/threonine protein kinase
MSATCAVKFVITESGLFHEMVFKLGQTIGGRYFVQETLGQGGVGVVYKVHDNERNRTVALKVLLPQYRDNEQAIARFKREVEVLRKLNHRAIVGVFDAGRIAELFFYTMEYVDGPSVQDWIKREKRLDYTSAVGVFTQVAEALEHAHSIAVHRDLSSDNVLVLGSGAVKLLDFGQAKLEITDSPLTAAGISMGKVFYCAPEQRMNAANVDKRADIYSMGVLLYEMLSGEMPLPYAPLQERFPDVPDGVDAIVLRMLARNPDDRYSSAAEAGLALQMVGNVAVESSS